MKLLIDLRDISFQQFNLKKKIRMIDYVQRIY